MLYPQLIGFPITYYVLQSCSPTLYGSYADGFWVCRGEDSVHSPAMTLRVPAAPAVSMGTSGP